MNTDMPDPAASARGAPLASNFTSSLDVDQRMYREDIAGSMAHARMLARQDIISQTDAAQIVGGLQQIEIEIESGEFEWKEELEDIHYERRIEAFRADRRHRRPPPHRPLP